MLEGSREPPGPDIRTLSRAGLFIPV